MTVRAFLAEDSNELADIFKEAVLITGRSAYSEHQLKAWAHVADDLAAFSSRLSEGHTVIAEVDGRAGAFGQLHPIDHLAMIYCRPCFGRSGLSSEILHCLERIAGSRGVLRIQTEASGISRPFFEKHGYNVTEVERAVRLGVEFKRYRMSKQLEL